MRHDFGGVGNLRLGRARLQQSPARCAFVDQQIKIVADHLESGELVVKARDRFPGSMTRECIFQRRDQEPHLRSHVGENKKHLVRARISLNERGLDPIVIDAGNQASLHQDRIGSGLGAEAMKTRLTIEKALRGADLVG